jgi:predicted nucleotidyltransferase component of viral defense system
MQIDFRAGEYGGTAKSHRHQKLQETLAHKGRGTDLVFDNFYTDEIPGKLPNGAELRVRINVANEVAIFAMKGITIGQRTKAKDYYDLFMLAKHFKGGPKWLAQSLIPFSKNKLVREAIENVREYFDSTKGLGPTSVADFKDEQDPAAREILQRDVFEVVQTLLNDIDHPATARRGHCR